MRRPADGDSTLEEVPSEGRRPFGHQDLHIVLECDRPLAGSTRHCLDDVDEVVFRRGRERRFVREQERLSGVRRLTLDLPDSRMSSLHAHLRRLDGHWVLEDADSRNGSYVHGRRVESASLADGTTFEFGHTHFLFRSRTLPRTLVAGPLDATAPAARDPALETLNHERQAVLGRMIAAARAGASILLIGEAGSGKDTLAHALHLEIGRRSAFVVVPCVLLGRRDASSPEKVAVELARDFDRAAGGTLFLDEIEELSPVAQLALLPLLRSPRRAKVPRIVSSVRAVEPRPQVPRIPADLLAELAGFAMPVPPLRDRREDLGALVAQLLRRAGGSDPARFTMDPLMGQALLLHDWPYNISELDSCIRTAVAQATDDCLRWSPPALFFAREPAGQEAAGDEQTTSPSLAHSTETVAEPEIEFARQVRRALKRNLSVSGLQKNGLLRSHMVLEATKGSTAATVTIPALREIFFSAIESLRNSSPRGEKQSRVLHLTFVKPTPTQQAAAEQLAMAFGTYRRYVTSALAELTSILWFNELSARQRQKHNVDDSGQEGAAREPTFGRLA
jgi:Sigma-54 interaction domain/FHA domain